MGGKSNSSAPPTTTAPPSQSYDSSAAMAAMIPMMTQVMLQSQQDIPKGYSAPEPVITPSVDWDAKQEEIRKRIAGDVTADLKRRRGRQYTVLTSPLVDEDDPSTVSAKTEGGPGPR